MAVGAETRALLLLADRLLIVFHTGLILFNCTGWMWRRTRRLHLACAGLTLASWVVLGFWFGFGYCLCTDLQWKMRAAMGSPVHAESYVQFLVESLTGWRPDVGLTTMVSGGVFACTTVASVILNLRDRRVRFVAADPSS